MEKEEVISPEKETKVILIFDENGNYFCETIGTSRAAKIINGNAANIHRVLSNGDIISTNGYYFLTKTQIRSKPISQVEKYLKVIIACNSISGLGNRIIKIHKIMTNED